jgi:hypothetical protein
MRLAGAIAALAAAPLSQAGEDSLFSSVPMADVRPSWEWVAGAAALAFVVGFLLGWRALDRRIRKKYGGLRIY